MRQRSLEARIAWTDVEHLKEEHTFPAPPISFTLTHYHTTDFWPLLYLFDFFMNSSKVEAKALFT